MEEEVVEVLVTGSYSRYKLEMDIEERFLSVHPANLWASILQVGSSKLK